ncbi:MAG: sigma-54 dependent transcriptional regulator [Candidatus Binatia bacterium]
MNTILVVDDDAVTCGLLADILQDGETTVLGETDPRAALSRLREEPVDLVITDVNMPQLDGLALLARLRDVQPDLPVIVMTAFGSIDTAVRAIGAGAIDYVSKPMDVDEVRANVRRALDRRREKERVAVPASGGLDDVVGRSPAMVSVYRTIARVAPTAATVLVLGESGTGKELIARAVHEHSPRRAGRFVAVDCASLGDALLESELFGHVRGAFTGAVGASPGLFVEADGGTIFLDEIGDVSPAMQARLLRVLQERQVRPVGGTRWTPVDVRIVAATHRDLAAEVAAGRFRQDLYYRLQVVTVALPALRERREDIPLLVDRLLSRAAQETGKQVRGVSDAALELLLAHAWPGNVRELGHVIERAVVLARHDVLAAEDFPMLTERAASHGGVAALAAASADEPRPTLEELKRRYVLSVLDEHGGNVSRAATVLGIDRRSLHRMLHRFGRSARARAGEIVATGGDERDEPLA